MRTVLHLSDLHFGAVDEELLAPLTELAHRIAPDVVVVSGDLTQRARREQFRAARAWLDTLPQPQLVVPGNHDISLYNLYRRFAEPLTYYKRYITDDLWPHYADDEIAVLGMNTARSLTFKDGRVNREQLDHIEREMAPLGHDVVRIIVTHHPFDLPASFQGQDLVGRAPLAMRAFAECGVDILLAGHLHASAASNTSARYPIEGFAALVVQAGTATSTRARGEENAFNVLHVEAARVEVERYAWKGSDFAPVRSDTFVREGDIWHQSQ